MNAADVFLHRNAQNIPHLTIVIADMPESDQTLIVSITTRRDYTDNTCVLTPSDYPRLEHESCIAYDRTNLAKRSILRMEIDRGKIVVGLPRLSDHLFLRVIDGFFTSRTVAKKWRDQVAQLFPERAAAMGWISR